MRNIIKSAPFNESEKLLSKLADKVFLSLWSFPNVYTDEGISKGQGEELCDLLVVFNEHVIIFSDKGEVTYKPTTDIKVGWKRWVKKAYLKSCFQAYRAEKWINEYPKRIFLDKKCSIPFPIEFPPADKIHIHRVVIVRGITKAASEYYSDDSGTLMLRPDIVGEEHFERPFMIGRPSHDKGYIHFFDEKSIQIVFDELDTIADLTKYLSKKEAFIDAGRLLTASGEDDLLGYYLSSYEDADAKGNPYFIDPLPENRVVVWPGFYESVRQTEVYKLMGNFRRASYFWDKAIDLMGQGAFQGKWKETNGKNYDEEIMVLRYMAAEHRFARSFLSPAVQEIVARPFPDDEVLPRVRIIGSMTNPMLCYLWLVLPRTSEFSDYQKYREARKNLLAHYCSACKDAKPQFEIIVGVACDAVNHEGGSEELIHVHTHEWGEAEYVEAKRIRNELGLLKNTTDSIFRHK